MPPWTIATTVRILMRLKSSPCDSRLQIKVRRSRAIGGHKEEAVTRAGWGTSFLLTVAILLNRDPAIKSSLQMLRLSDDTSG
jgi:hypothetical protein